MTVILTFGLLFALFALRVPVAFALGLSAVAYMVLGGDVSLLVIPQRMVNGLDSFPLMAIPFFVLAGQLMNSCGATEHIFGFANSLVGRFRGGLGHVNVVANMIMAGMSGSAAADASGLGTVIIPAMEKQGYGKKFSAAVTGSAAIIGPIIPPSIPMVIYGALVNVSVGRLFLGGFVPGIMLGLAFMVRVYLISRRRNYPQHGVAPLWRGKDRTEGPHEHRGADARGAGARGRGGAHARREDHHRATLKHAEEMIGRGSG